MRNGRNVLEINQNHQYQVSPSEAGHGSILVIIATQRQDEGKYICMAKNALDEYNITFVVEVKGNNVFLLRARFSNSFCYAKWHVEEGEVNRVKMSAFKLSGPLGWSLFRFLSVA